MQLLRARFFRDVEFFFFQRLRDMFDAVDATLADRNFTGHDGLLTGNDGFFLERNSDRLAIADRADIAVITACRTLFDEEFFVKDGNVDGGFRRNDLLGNDGFPSLLAALVDE